MIPSQPLQQKNAMIQVLIQATLTMKPSGLFITTSFTKILLLTNKVVCIGLTLEQEEIVQTPTR